MDLKPPAKALEEQTHQAGVAAPGRVTLRNVEVWRGEAAQRRLILSEISLDLEAGARVALVGPNGAGKTSLLLALVGAAGFSGQISVGGTPLERRTLDELRRRVGFVFADPSDQLFMPTVLDEVAFGPRQRDCPEPEIASRVEGALEQVQLLDRKSERPSALSLGEQRRLAVASVLACDPELILLDEPTAGLDPAARFRMLRVIRSTQATVLFATHDLDAALDLSAHVVLLNGGRVVHQGPAQDVLTNPALLEAAGLSVPAESR